jgi:hypothetical protein
MFWRIHTRTVSLMKIRELSWCCNRPISGAECNSPALCPPVVTDVAYGTWCPQANYLALNFVDVHQHEILISQIHLLSSTIILRIIVIADGRLDLLCYDTLWWVLGNNKHRCTCRRGSCDEFWATTSMNLPSEEEVVVSFGQQQA